MAFELTQEEQLIVQAVRELAATPAGTAHWRERAQKNEFPERLWAALAEAGYLGVLVPEEYGGTGLGLTQMALLMETMASEGKEMILNFIGEHVLGLPRSY